jgi:hypothetical protein
LNSACPPQWAELVRVDVADLDLLAESTRPHTDVPSDPIDEQLMELMGRDRCEQVAHEFATWAGISRADVAVTGLGYPPAPRPGVVPSTEIAWNYPAFWVTPLTEPNLCDDMYCALMWDACRRANLVDHRRCWMQIGGPYGSPPPSIAVIYRKPAEIERRLETRRQYLADYEHWTAEADAEISEAFTAFQSIVDRVNDTIDRGEVVIADPNADIGQKWYEIAILYRLLFTIRTEVYLVAKALESHLLQRFPSPTVSDTLMEQADPELLEYTVDMARHSLENGDDHHLPRRDPPVQSARRHPRVHGTRTRPAHRTGPASRTADRVVPTGRHRRQ